MTGRAMEIKSQLSRASNDGQQLADMPTILSAISQLEQLPMSKFVLSGTRIGKLVNDIRKAARDVGMKERLKHIIRAWSSLTNPAVSDHDTVVPLIYPRQAPPSSINDPISSNNRVSGYGNIATVVNSDALCNSDSCNSVTSLRGGTDISSPLTSNQSLSLRTDSSITAMGIITSACSTTINKPKYSVTSLVTSSLPHKSNGLLSTSKSAVSLVTSCELPSSIEVSGDTRNSLNLRKSLTVTNLCESVDVITSQLMLEDNNIVSKLSVLNASSSTLDSHNKHRKRSPECDIVASSNPKIPHLEISDSSVTQVNSTLCSDNKINHSATNCCNLQISNSYMTLSLTAVDVNINNTCVSACCCNDTSTSVTNCHSLKCLKVVSGNKRNNFNNKHISHNNKKSSVHVNPSCISSHSNNGSLKLVIKIPSKDKASHATSKAANKHIKSPHHTTDNNVIKNNFHSVHNAPAETCTSQQYSNTNDSITNVTTNTPNATLSRNLHNVCHPRMKSAAELVENFGRNLDASARTKILDVERVPEQSVSQLTEAIRSRGRHRGKLIIPITTVSDYRDDSNFSCLMQQGKETIMQKFLNSDVIPISDDLCEPVEERCLRDNGYLDHEICNGSNFCDDFAFPNSSSINDCLIGYEEPQALDLVIRQEAVLPPFVTKAETKNEDVEDTALVELTALQDELHSITDNCVNDPATISDNDCKVSNTGGLPALPMFNVDDIDWNKDNYDYATSELSNAIQGCLSTPSCDHVFNSTEQRHQLTESFTVCKGNGAPLHILPWASICDERRRFFVNSSCDISLTSNDSALVTTSFAKNLQQVKNMLEDFW